MRIDYKVRSSKILGLLLLLIDIKDMFLVVNRADVFFFDNDAKIGCLDSLKEFQQRDIDALQNWLSLFRTNTKCR